MSLAQRQVILEHGKTRWNCPWLFQEAVVLREFPSRDDCWCMQSDAGNCSCRDVRTTVSRTQLSLSIPSIFCVTMSQHFTAFSLSFGSSILSSSSSAASPVRQMTQMSPLGRSMQQSLILSSLTSYESLQSPLLAVKWGFADEGWEQKHSSMDIICV